MPQGGETAQIAYPEFLLLVLQGKITLTLVNQRFFSLTYPRDIHLWIVVNPASSNQELFLPRILLFSKFQI